MLKMTEKKIEQYIIRFRKDIAPNLRYASYDFCYLYFQQNKGQLSHDMEDSCMHLWSYLASWGMLRGSSKLQQRSPAALKPLIEYLDKADSKLWDMDVDAYDETNMECLLEVYNDIENIMTDILSDGKEEKHRLITLITKIMLGVFGNVPAFDRYFTETFHEIYGGFSSFQRYELEKIRDFYFDNKLLLDKLVKDMYVIDFNGHPTSLKYKIAKLIDMFGFSTSAPKK